MNNKPVAWLLVDKNWNDFCRYSSYPTEGAIPLYTHPAKELHLSLQKSKETGELLAVTYTDDEHRIVEVLWQKPPAKTLTISDRDILKIIHDKFTKFGFEADYIVEDTELIDFARAILRKASEK